MLSFDTNLAVHAANRQAREHLSALKFVESLAENRRVAICELMLVELFLKLCNRKIFEKPMIPSGASEVCQTYRNNRAWVLVENAPVMSEVWRVASSEGFAFRRVVDVRLALTLRHHGVTHFATTNVKDFIDLGFARVWNPLTDADEASLGSSSK